MLGIVLLLSWPRGRCAASDYAGELLCLGAGARAAGMGNAFVAISDDASAGYWNAAGLSVVERREAAVMHAERFAGLVAYSAVVFATPLVGEAGLGITLLRVGVDGIKYTQLEDRDEPLSATNRARLERTVGNADYALYFSYGRRTLGRLSLGGSAKLIRRSIGDNTAFGYGVDLGALYKYSVFSIGLNLRNVTSSPMHWDTGTTDRIAPSLDVGLACVQRFPALSSRVVGVIGAYQDGEVSHRDGADALNMGLEYWYSEVLSARLGSLWGKLTAGMGLRLHDRVGVDYAFTQHKALGNSHRVSASLWL